MEIVAATEVSLAVPMFGEPLHGSHGERRRGEDGATMKSGLFLVHRSNGVVVTHFTLVEGVNVVGRTAQSHIYLADWSVSRPHAEIHVAKGGVKVRDLKSLNGTFVNQLRVRSCPLRPGQQVRFGDVYFTLSTENPSDSSEFDTSDPRCSGKPSLQPPSIPTGHLTPSQCEVFELLRKGLSEKEVAANLGISPHTAHNHIRKIYRAFRVNSNRELLSHLLPPLDQTVILGNDDIEQLRNNSEANPG